MPLAFEYRPLNTKIVFYNRRNRKYHVFNTTNTVHREFTSLQRMFSYHSDNTQFIDYASSELVDKERSIRNGMIMTQNKVIVYRNRVNGIYCAMDGREVTIPAIYRNRDNASYCVTDGGEVIYYCLIGYQFNIVRIQQISTRIINTGLTGTIGPSIFNNISDNILRDTEQVNEHLIYSYHGGPREVFFKQADNESQTNKYYGIELEIDMDKAPRSAQTSRRRNVLATRLNALLNENNYNSLVKFEGDASIGAMGVEIITQPMTMNYILSNKEKFKEAMRIIDELEYSSHDSGKCGMHIHVSRDYLSETTLDNIFLIFENFKNEIIAFSRRNQSQMRWCRFMTDDNTSRESMNKEYINQNKCYRTSHGCAINNGNTKTVEFRIFRGTTKLRTFLANIQLIDNIIEIAKNQDVNGITWNMIINHNKEYTELKEYNEKRGIISKHELSTTINRIEVTQRPVVLVRPFQITLEGDN